MTQKVIKIGSSVGVILSKETRKALKVKAGDTIEVKLHPSARSAIITPSSRQSSGSDRIARLTYRFIQRYRRDLEALAKQ